MACSIALLAMAKAMKAMKKKNDTKKEGENLKKTPASKKNAEKKEDKEKAPKAAASKKGTHAEAFRNWLLVF